MGARRYKAEEWARLVRGDWEGEEAVKKETHPAPRPNHQPPNPQSPKLVTRKPPHGILSPMTHRMEPPPSQKRDTPTPPSPPPPPRLHRPPPPPRQIPPQRWGGVVPKNPSWALKSASCTPWGCRLGPVIGVHRRKAGVVWVGYPGNPTLYEVARGLLFPSPLFAQEHLDRVRKGEGKATPPPPSGQPDPKTNPLTDPKTNHPTNSKTNPPGNPKAQKIPTPNPTCDPTQELWDPKTGSQEVLSLGDTTCGTDGILAMEPIMRTRKD